VLSDLLGSEIVNAIADELYALCKKLSRRIIVVSYTGEKQNGDDVCAIKFAISGNMPIITNDLMNKDEDIYFSECESHSYRFVKPQYKIQDVPIINKINKCIKSY